MESENSTGNRYRSHYEHNQISINSIYYRQRLSEQAVDGYLLLAATDPELQWSLGASYTSSSNPFPRITRFITYLGIDTKFARKKISAQLTQVLEKEQKIEDNWHLRARVTKPRPDNVYIIYDPDDARLAANLNADIARRGMKVRYIS